MRSVRAAHLPRDELGTVLHCRHDCVLLGIQRGRDCLSGAVDAAEEGEHGAENDGLDGVGREGSCFQWTVYMVLLGDEANRHSILTIHPPSTHKSKRRFHHPGRRRHGELFFFSSHHTASSYHRHFYIPPQYFTIKAQELSQIQINQIPTYNNPDPNHRFPLLLYRKFCFSLSPSS